jgi:hypothetical protein
VSPRRHRRLDDAAPALDDVRARLGVEAVQAWGDREWMVRGVVGGPKTYRCPGCDQEIAAGVAHVVAWPVDGAGGVAGAGGLDDRRHWHRGCWQARDRRAPGVQRRR